MARRKSRQNGKRQALISDLDAIHKEVDMLYEKLLIKRPEHFGYPDIFNALFAAGLFSVLIFNILLIELALSMSIWHVAATIIATAIILTLEIYFISYSRVEEKNRRRFGQFWAKRFFTIYGVTMLICTMMIYIYNLDAMAGGLHNVAKIAIATSFPASIAAGATALSKRFL